MDRKYLLALLLPDWWGRPTQSALQGYEVTRAFYSGVLTLALAAAGARPAPAFGAGRGRRVRPAGAGRRGRHPAGVRRRDGAARLQRDLQHPPDDPVPALRRAPGRVGAGRAGRARPPRAAHDGAARRPSAVGLVAVPALALAAEGRISLRFLGDALGVASGFAHPPGLSSPDVEAVVRLAALVVWVLAAGAALVLLALRRSGRLAAGTFATLAVAIVAVDLFRAGMGENPGLTLAPGPPARHRRHPLPAGAAPRPLRRAAGANGRAGPAAGHRDALRALRRALLRLPRGASLRPPVAARGRPAPALPAVDHARAVDPGAPCGRCRCSVSPTC